MNASLQRKWVRRVRAFIVVTSCALILLSIPAFGDKPRPAVPSPKPTAVPTFEDSEIKLTPIFKLYEPTSMAVRPRDDRLYVAQKGGRVYAIRNGRSKLLLDIRDEVTNKGEQGLLGMTFTPSGKRIIIYFVDLNEDSRARSYAFDGGPIDKRTARPVLFIDHPNTIFHYSGNLAFGPDGYLYMSVGDGGFPADTPNNAQSLDRVLGKILRFDVRDDGSVAIPPTNPFVSTPGARPEIWDYGFRNPWRFSFDAEVGDLWVADVGMTLREEINVERAGSKGGRNYGWHNIEGTNLINGPVPVNVVPPTYEYEHHDGICAVIGGYVYRGFNMPGLRGTYLFADICHGHVEALKLKDRLVVGHRTFEPYLEQMASFGQDGRGNLYILSLTKGIFRIDPA